MTDCFHTEVGFSPVKGVDSDGNPFREDRWICLGCGAELVPQLDVDSMRRACVWLLNLSNGIGKNGGIATSAEWDEAWLAMEKILGDKR